MPDTHDGITVTDMRFCRADDQFAFIVLEPSDLDGCGEGLHISEDEYTLMLEGAKPDDEISDDRPGRVCRRIEDRIGAEVIAYWVGFVPAVCA